MMYLNATFANFRVKGDCKTVLVDKELFEKFFKDDNRANFINLDINTFDVLNKLMAEGQLKNNRHKTFAFSYYWLVSYLWKYSKYGSIKIDTQDIKTILGIANEKRMDYIIKKNGLMDSVGLTETTRNFPICTSFDDYGVINVSTLSDFDEEDAKYFLSLFNSRYTCKKPLLQYERNGKAGMMFSRDDVFSISILEFTRCVLCPEIGFDGFYIYAYLKFREKMLGGSAVKICYTKLESEIGYKHRKIRTLIQNLVSANMIQIVHQEKKEGEDYRLARINSYKTVFLQNYGV